MQNSINIRNATMKDAQALFLIETACLPPNQAASLETLSNRLSAYPQHFWLIEENGIVVGFVNGMVTNYDTVKDEMFRNTQMHDENGAWQSVFGLAVSPDYQNMGYAGKLLQHLFFACSKQKRKGIVLTCEEHLINYYLKFGFINMGISESVHGGDVFFDMKKEL